MISFEEQVASIRQHLADIYERNQNWREAANVLVGIPLETGQKYIYIHIYQIMLLFAHVILTKLIFSGNILLITNSKLILKLPDYI